MDKKEKTEEETEQETEEEKEAREAFRAQMNQLKEEFLNPLKQMVHNELSTINSTEIIPLRRRDYFIRLIEKW